MATRSSRTSSLSQLTADRSALLSRRTFAAAGGAAAGMAAAAALTRQAYAGFLSDFYANALGASGATGEADATGVSRRPMLLQQLAGADASEDADQVPSCVDNPWAADLSNVANVADTYLTDAQASALAQRGFFQALMAGGSEFFQLYESNRYNLFPSFVTVDAMVHTYHLYFAYLLRTCERDRLSAQLCELSRRMLVASVGQLQALAGTEWEAAATLCAGFFAVGTALLDAGASELAQVPAQVQQAVDAELALIYAADGVEPSPLFDQSGLAVASAGDASLGEDYSQYAPRGYYAGDAQLEAYFRAMMWYGRRSFTQSNEVLDRCALLATLALAQADDTGEAPAEEWGAVYQVTAFFAGASDDNGYYEYLPLAQQAYGADVSVTSLPGDNAAWRAFHQLTAEAPSPQINSVPMRDEGEGADHVSANQGFRFMGQRFTVDEAVFQKLVYSEVGARDDGACRMLPDVLDLPAALGSAPAYAILDAQGDTGYAGYAENLGKLQTALEEAPADLWRASLAAQWLNMLRPLLDEKGAGWPNALRGDAWARATSRPSPAATRSSSTTRCSMPSRSWPRRAAVPWRSATTAATWSPSLRCSAACRRWSRPPRRAWRALACWARRTRRTSPSSRSWPTACAPSPTRSCATSCPRTRSSTSSAGSVRRSSTSGRPCTSRTPAASRSRPRSSRRPSSRTSPRIPTAACWRSGRARWRRCTSSCRWTAR